MPTTYITAYITKLGIDENADPNFLESKNEMIITAAAATGNVGETPRVQKIKFPHTNWYSAKDGDEVLGWSDPNIGPELENNTPWGIPIFSMPEDDMGDNMTLGITLLDLDSYEASDLVRISTQLLPGLLSFVGSAVATPAAGAAVGGLSEAILDAVSSAWDEADELLAAFAVTLTRDEDWGVEGGPIGDIRTAKGQALFEIRVRRVVVEHELDVVVTLNRATLDDDDGDKYVDARGWGGKFLGDDPLDQLTRVPEPRHRTRRLIGRELDIELYRGPIGPFLSLDIGFWEHDPGLSDDDDFGTLFGLWHTDALWDTFRRNGWLPLQFRNIRRNRNRHMNFDFTIEPAEPLMLPLTQWSSPSRGDHFTTTDPSWQARFLDERRRPDYRSVDSGSMTFNPALPQPRNTVPLLALYNSRRKDNFLTSDPAYAGQIGETQAGYFRWRVEGYVYDPALPQPAWTLPLYSWWNGDRKDNLTSSRDSWRGEIGDQREGYELYRLEGYVVNWAADLI